MEVSPKTLGQTELRLFQAMPGNSALLLPNSPDFTIAAVTDDFIKTTGTTKEAIVGKGLFEVFPNPLGDADRNSENQLRASLEQVIIQKEAQRHALHRYNILLADGTFDERYWSNMNKPLLNDAGEIVCIIHTVEDLTDNINAERQADQLRYLKRSFELFMQAPVAICIVSGADYLVELANEHMQQLLGRTVAMVGKPIEASLPEARMQGLMAILDEVHTTGQTFHAADFAAELMIDGVREQRYFDLVFQPYFQQAGDSVPTGIFCVAYNVTKQIRFQKQLEEAKAETERQKRLYEAVTSSTPDLMYIFDLGYRFTYVNEALLTMWGKSWEETIGRGLLDNGYEPWHAAMHEREIDQVAATKLPVRGEVSFPHAELGTRIYDYIFVPVLNKRGDVEAVAGTTRDITEIKKAEEVLRQSQEKLEALVAERTQELQRSNASLEEFAYAASHDMKEPIRKIHFFTDRLKSRLYNKLEEEDLRNFGRMEAAAQRMSTLIDDLLTYSHFSKGISHEETVDLNDTIKLVEEDMELIIEEKNAKVVVDRLPTLKGHRRQLQQLFENLIGNALKYSKPNVAPVIRIATKLIRGIDTSLKLSAEEANKSYHLIEVQDNGIGFEQADAERIFNVFTRLHGMTEYKGTGIGLSIVRKVAENHNGYAWAESNPGHGSMFSILLPVT